MMIGMTFLMVVAWFLGIILAIKTYLWIQLLAVICTVLFLIHKEHDGGELGGLGYIPPAIVGGMGLLIGDLIYYIHFYDTTTNLSILDAITWFFKP
jgi:hypothetical protein